MFGWLRRRARQRKTQQTLVAFAEFLDVLRRTSDQEMGLVLAQTYHWQGRLKSQFGWDLEDPNLVSAFDWTAAGQMAALMRQVESQEPRQKCGLLIWTYSLRALTANDCRDAGKAMWAEIVRGAAHAEDGARLLREFGLAVDASRWGCAPSKLTSVGLLSPSGSIARHQ